MIKPLLHDSSTFIIAATVAVFSGILIDKRLALLTIPAAAILFTIGVRQHVQKRQKEELHR